MTRRPLTAQDKAFLARHRAIGNQDPDNPMRCGAELVEIAGEVRALIGNSVRFFDGTKVVFLPKQYVVEEDGGTIKIPEWLAKDRGLI